MDIQDFDAIVIGAGIAGATVARALSATHRTALIEAEEQPGYHSTGRSAAMWLLNYGPPDVRTLSALSRPFFETPPPGFSEVPLIRHRTVLFVAPADAGEGFDTLLAEGAELEIIPPAAARDLVPALRPGYAAQAAVERGGFDLDVAAIHQGYLRRLRADGGVLALRSRTGRIARRDKGWDVHVTTGDVFRAPVVVNAAGAWGDVVAEQAGVVPLGLTPCRRTGVIVDPSPWAVAEWPMIHNVAAPDAGTWYARPDSRTRLMVSPADQTPMAPQDIQPDELDIAIAIDRMTQGLDIHVRRVERPWAGLRTFTPDGSLAFGADADAPGFFWCVGQGGYGIQTSPAAGDLVADLVRGADPGAAAAIVGAVDPRRFRRA
jgi:D-arginine dehydrogenase